MSRPILCPGNSGRREMTQRLSNAVQIISKSMYLLFLIVPLVAFLQMFEAVQVSVYSCSLHTNAPSCCLVQLNQGVACTLSCDKARHAVVRCSQPSYESIPLRSGLGGRSCARPRTWQRSRGGSRCAGADGVHPVQIVARSARMPQA
jgi:hypothetical protein